jgi:hypothetical protein
MKINKLIDEETLNTAARLRTEYGTHWLQIGYKNPCAKLCNKHRLEKEKSERSETPSIGSSEAWTMPLLSLRNLIPINAKVTTECTVRIPTDLPEQQACLHYHAHK